MLNFRHVTNPKRLIEILKEERFRPVYPSPLAGDSGINGYIEGYDFTRSQAIEARGAELIFEWHENFIELGKNGGKYPLPPNQLYRMGAWRAVIPAGTDKTLLKLVGFEVENDALKTLPLWSRLYLKIKAYKLKKQPVYLLLKA